ncbi:O-antigen ligase family protein [Acuticoccus sp. M5D2P5]|uniref:O-antigen ligase family protein n=1 Tax=Acuticoccus kalidii TaxID=2910977 RepID=UPI001F47C0EB|nr:O-antigen ligase family protein [Acuticoccus kalidii]MCF3933454.1 O-antigen ligase family protein [Acuticoccus kalidii]
MSEPATWIEYLPRREKAAAARRAIAWEVYTERAAAFLLVLTVLFLLIGLNPLAKDDGQSAGGSTMRQIVLLGLAGLAAPLLLLRLRMALAILARSWSLLLVFAALAMTTFWSAYPSVTIRRFIVFVILFVIALAIASVLNTPRKYLTPLMIAFAITLLADYAVTLALPGRAFTPLGLAALHASKNTAGMVAQMMTIVFAAALLAERRAFQFWAIAGFAVLSLGFLALTLSKTSLGITVLIVFGLVPIFVLARRNKAIALFIPIGLVAIAGLVVFATGAFQLSGADWARILTGDPTLTERDQIWRASLLHIENRPYFGYGFGAQWSMLPIYHPLWNYAGFWTGNEDNLNILRQSHNGYLDIMIHGGVVLATAVAIFIVHAFWDIGRAIGKRSADRWDIAGSAMFAAFFVSLLISNMLESTLFFPEGLLGQFLILLLLAHTAWQTTPTPNHR